MTVYEAPSLKDSRGALLLDVYQQDASSTDRSGLDGLDGLNFMLLGLFEQVGSLLSELKKRRERDSSYATYCDSLTEEFGDVLWYFANTAIRAGLSLSSLAERVLVGAIRLHSQVKQDVRTFVDLQIAINMPAETRTESQYGAIRLAGVVGILLHKHSNTHALSDKNPLAVDLSEVLRVLALTAADAGISLDIAARRNLEKTTGRWPQYREWGPLYDACYPPEEQLPRVMVVVFSEREVGGKKFVVQQFNGINVGDRLTDNRDIEDDYRFHDIFHLTYAAILGWSPTLRKLLKVKRKSNPEVDENQDGARATLIEEGIATWIFNHAERNAHFRSSPSLDFNLLKSVQNFVRGYEVESRPLWQWEHAILESFRMFRLLRKHRGGRVTANLLTHTITFEPSEPC